MTDYKAVIFDMDGLMFDTETIYFQANQKTADRVGLDFTKDFYLDHVGGSERDFFQAMYDHFEDKDKVDRFMKESQADVYDLLTSDQVPKKEGLIDLLDYLKKEGIQMVVASSSDKWLVDKVVTINGVKDYFVDLVGGDEVDQTKPEPDIFLMALDKLGTSKAETLILEDSLNGVRAGYAAGLATIMIPDLIQPGPEAREKSLAIEENLRQVIKYFK